MGGVCWYGEIYWNANLSSYLLFRGSSTGPPPLFSVTQSLHSLLSENLRAVVTQIFFLLHEDILIKLSNNPYPQLLFLLVFWHLDLSNKEQLVFVATALALPKKPKTFYSPQKRSKKRNNLFFFVLGTFSVLSALQSDVVIAQHLHNGQWKACLSVFAGSGDSCPLARSKNRLRTQTICSPERPGGTHAQMGLCFWTLSCFMLHDGSCDLLWVFWCFFFLLAAPGSDVGDITNYRVRLVSFERHKLDIDKVQVEDALDYT